MDKKTAQQVFLKLEQLHPQAGTELDFETPFELLTAVILSAQCTDKRVNIVTKELFKKYKTAADFAALTQEELEPLIFSTGFYRNKAKNIISAAKTVVEKFDGELPSNYDDLLSLAGVGRKTANVVWAEAFGGNAIAVDTHVHRVSNRIGLVSAKTPEQTEQQLMRLFPESQWSRLHHLLIFQGRYTCKSQRPDCGNCNLTDICMFYNKKEG